jgi:biotin carboxyl carrier protein
MEHAERSQRSLLPAAPIRYRNNPYPGPPMRFEIGGHECRAHSSEPGVEILKVEILNGRAGSVEALVNGVRHQFYVQRHGEECYIRSSAAQRTVTRLPRYPRPAGAGQHQTANSPMPGQVLRVLVTPGQTVKMGDSLIVLEAMKMEQTIKATMDGVVGTILVKPGEIVAPGQTLIEIESKEDAHEHADGPTNNH